MTDYDIPAIVKLDIRDQVLAEVLATTDEGPIPREIVERMRGRG